MKPTVATPTLPRGPSTCSRRRRSGATRRHGQEDADPEDKEKQSPCPNTKGDIVDLASFDEVVNDDGEDSDIGPQVCTRFSPDSSATTMLRKRRQWRLKIMAAISPPMSDEVYIFDSGHAELQQRQC